MDGGGGYYIEFLLEVMHRFSGEYVMQRFFSESRSRGCDAVSSLRGIVGEGVISSTSFLCFWGNSLDGTSGSSCFVREVHLSSMSNSIGAMPIDEVFTRSS